MRAHLAYAGLFLLVTAPAGAVNWMPTCPRPAVTTQRPPPSPQPVAARQAERQACAAEIAQYCGTVPSGCGRPMQCLRTHGAQLSPVCANALSQLRATAHAVSH
jgi:hypothetical protein